MTPPHAALDERAIEQLLTGHSAPAAADLQPPVALMRSLADGPAPRPNAALADLLERGFDPAPALLRPTTPHRAWSIRVGGVLTAAAASLLVAGTAQALPAPLQQGLADLVSALSPFELPRPEPAEARPEPGPESPDDVAPSGTPEPSVTPPPSAAPASPTADDQRDEQGDAATAAERTERDRQRAAEDAREESQRAEEDAADEAEDAADASEDADDDAAGVRREESADHDD